MSNKNQIKALLKTYIDVRRGIYEAIIQNKDSLAKELNARKHGIVSKIFGLFNDQEYEIVEERFLEIVENKISTCSTKDMAKYIKDMNSDKYLTCLDFQEEALQKMIDEIMPHQKGDRMIMFADYGGSSLRKKLISNPINLSDCDINRAIDGDIKQQICMAKAYICAKDCKSANEWAKMAFERDSMNEENEPVLDLLGTLEITGECNPE